MRYLIALTFISLISCGAVSRQAEETLSAPADSEQCSPEGSGDNCQVADPETTGFLPQIDGSKPGTENPELPDTGHDSSFNTQGLLPFQYTE